MWRKKDGSLRSTNADLKSCQYLPLQIRMLCNQDARSPDDMLKGIESLHNPEKLSKMLKMCRIADE